MCIAILNKTGIIDKETLRNCWNANRDGAGYSYYNGKDVIITKQLEDFDGFYKRYQCDRKRNKNVPFSIHFRIATSGKIDKSNCHPFRINKDISVIHNGIIDCVETCANHSDTFYFNELILKELPANWYNNAAIIELIKQAIGYSKLVFIIDSEYLIINEMDGHWLNGNWYSNNSYKQYPKHYTPLPYHSKECDCCGSTDKTTYNDSYGMNVCKECDRLYISPYTYPRYYDNIT